MSAPVRIRMKASCPWPERRGAAGVVLARPSGPEGRVYPWAGLGRNEVVVLLDDDPLADASEHAATWSCVVSWVDVEPEPAVPMGRQWEGT